MATDASGTPTSLGIRKLNTSVDAPSGLGFNGAMDDIDALLTARISKPAGLAAGEVPVWNGTGWDRSSVTRISSSSLGTGGGGTGTKFLADDQTFKTVSGMSVIADLTLGVSQASFDTNTILSGNIPSTFKSLKIVASLRCDVAAGNTSAQVRFNNDTAANYEWQFMRASGSATSAAEGLGATFALVSQPAAASAPASQFDALEATVADYLSSNLKSMIAAGTQRSSAATTGMQIMTASGFWLSTAAINRVTLFPASGNWVAGSRFTLYGLA